MPSLATGGSPNGDVRIAVAGLGGINIVGGVGGRGRQLIKSFLKVPGVRIVALCDVDRAILDDGARQFKDRGENVATHVDFRRVLDDKSVDAVVLATPNHWHALGTIWACQAGKDVYVVFGRKLLFSGTARGVEDGGQTTERCFLDEQRSLHAQAV